MTVIFFMATYQFHNFRKYFSNGTEIIQHNEVEDFFQLQFCILTHWLELTSLLSIDTINNQNFRLGDKIVEDLASFYSHQIKHLQQSDHL